MPQSSRHISSKHRSRDCSDSEKDSGLKEKEKKSKDEISVRFLKEYESGTKRKLDSKDTGGKNLSVSGNDDYVEEYSSSKRRKERADDGVRDRWNGGEDDGKGDKRSKGSSELKSKRLEDADGDDTKKSKSEGKHLESSRKEEREREKKGKYGKSDEHCIAKQSAERTDLDVPDRLLSPESEIQLEKGLGKRRDASGDGDKHLEDNVDILDRQLSVSNDTVKDGRAKDEKYKDEKYKDKYREDMNCEDKCQNDKLRDDRSASDHANSKSSEKNLRDGKEDVKVRQKKSKVQVSDFERDRDHDRERERDRDRERHREREREHEHERDRECEHYRDLDCDHYRERDHNRDHDYYRERDRNRNRDHDHDRDYDFQWDRDRDHDRDRERDRRYSDRDKDRDRDHDELHDERRSARYKDSKGRKRSPDDRDDGNDTKSRGAKGQYSDLENRSTSSRVEVDADGGRSQSRPANLDAALGSNRRRASPSPSSHGGTDEYRHFKQEDSKYRDPMTEQRSKAASSREVTSFSEIPERGAKYRSMEKSSRVDEGHSGELQIERSSRFKASPKSLMEKSPSTSLERRYMSRNGVRRGLDIEETGWNSASVGGREEDNRLSRDLPPEKPLLDGYSQADSVFYNRTGQHNSSLIPQQPGSSAGISSPSFMGSLEEDNRFNNSGRYKRSGDMNVRRGHANAWRGAPNWPGPVPNGFIPFQPGPPHGGFQAMIPQFPSPSLFGVRPSMEINHSGIPYHIPDAERFNNHLHPMGWQNVMDGSGPAHFHGWDGHNVNFRDEAHMFGGPKWDQNRDPVNGRGWDASSDVWKGQNGDVDLPSTSQKEDHPLQAPVDVYDGQECRRSQYENDSNGIQVKGLEIRSDAMSPVKESSRVSLEIPQKASDSNKISSEDDDAHYCQFYLSKLDISAELAGSDLYDQCMGLLTVERSKYLAKDATKLVNLKNGARSVQNASIAVRSPSLIPATNASVFQKAMDLYKKQRLEMGAILNVNGGMVALASAPKEKGKEQSSDHVVGEAEEPVLISDAEMVDSAMLDSDQQKEEVVPTATLKENMEQLVSFQRRESSDDLDSLSPEKSELPNTDFGHMNPEVPNPVLNGNKAEETETELMSSGDVVVDPLRSLDKASEAVGLAANGENSNDVNETEGNSSVYCAKEKHAFDDAISGSLNDSPKESGGLIPGSNESGSESVILSRIHHSPENTH